jgi:molybdopterin converting factor subunit 1
VKARVRLFASFREVVGADMLELDVDDAATVGGIWRELVRQYPGLDGLTPSAAVNAAYAQPGTWVDQGDEVAFLPPVSGG